MPNNYCAARTTAKDTVDISSLAQDGLSLQASSKPEVVLMRQETTRGINYIFEYFLALASSQPDVSTFHPKDMQPPKPDRSCSWASTASPLDNAQGALPTLLL